MIRLPPRPPAPNFFSGPEITAFKADAKQFYDARTKSRRQTRFDFPYLPKSMFSATMDVLMAWTSHKCSYCEQPLKHSGNASLERFRPKAGARDVDGSFSVDHYWWLAFEWRNIHVCCATCNKLKGSKFPMTGRRCARETPYESLANEPRLLVDPTEDEPTHHLHFQRDGMVESLTPAGDATIATLELNRGDLVRDRRRAAASARRLLKNPLIQGAIGEWGENWLAHLRDEKPLASRNSDLYDLANIVSDDAPFSAAARQMVWTFLQEHAGAEAAMPALAAAVRGPLPRAIVPAKPAGTPASQLHSQIITRIAIRNFRGVSDLDLKIDLSVGSGAPWTVMLGENGVGKSSILQAVALTLLDRDVGALRASPRDMLRKGASSGFVRVWFHAAEIPRELTFRKNGRRFMRTGPPYSGTLLGYGATRLLPRGAAAQKQSSVKLQNMFDPFHPLLDANRWLGRLGKAEFDFVARALRDVLGLPRGVTLRRLRSRQQPGVRLLQHGAELSLDDLSDGYQSVLGLTCDVIAGLRATQSGATDASEAVVIIDELGAHLHPRWRMRIVTNLRRAFKRVQFIASTHDPLCLRGLEDKEAIVLRKTQRGRVYPLDDLPPLKGMRVDQLLTSEFFGLDSTLDPDVEAQYRELYRRLAIRKPNKRNTLRIEELREALKPYDLPGATRRERRLMQVIDSELAKIDETPDPTRRKEIRNENEAIIQELLKSPVPVEATS